MMPVLPALTIATCAALLCALAMPARAQEGVAAGAAGVTHGDLSAELAQGGQIPAAEGPFELDAVVTVAEVENLVEAGQIDPDHIHTPGIFVKRIVHVPNGPKRIENRTTRPRPTAA